MGKLEKSKRREQQRQKKILGMKMHGKNIHIIADAQRKRYERLRKEAQDDTND